MSLDTETFSTFSGADLVSRVADRLRHLPKSQRAACLGAIIRNLHRREAMELQYAWSLHAPLPVATRDWDPNPASRSATGTPGSYSPATKGFGIVNNPRPGTSPYEQAKALLAQGPCAHSLRIEALSSTPHTSLQSKPDLGIALSRTTTPLRRTPPSSLSEAQSVIHLRESGQPAARLLQPAYRAVRGTRQEISSTYLQPPP